MIYDVCIIGAGASGMVAAITAAKQGASVLVLERMDKVGKKILATGNGKCNLTNTQIKSTHIPVDAYRGRFPEFAKKIIEQFDYEDTIRLFEAMSIYTISKNGYIYPASEQAVSVNDALKWQMAELKIDVRTGIHVQQIKYEKYFSIMSSKNQFKSYRLILATGGKASQVLGSDGSGYELARQMKHKIIQPVPALCGLHCKDKFIKELSGIRLQGKVSLMDKNRLIAKDEGELQMTAYGISGIPVFQISRYAAEMLEQKQKPVVVLDLLPGWTERKFADAIRKSVFNHPKWTLNMILAGMMNKKLAACVIKKCGYSLEEKATQIDLKGVRNLFTMLKQMRLEIIATNTFEQAQVTAGGVSTEAIDYKSMTSKYNSNLYIVGELLDIDGICGGFNLQFAFATGYIAGKHAGRRYHVKG